MSLTAGQLVGGHYEVMTRLGGGGFGETYLSRDLHLPDRPSRVIKRLCPRNSDSSLLQLSRRLFETEAQVLYRLGAHPQIPQLFAHFEELSEFYLVQEYIDGKDLSHELIRGKIWEQFAVVDLLQNLLTVLSFVHQHNVIHRDIKPENIIRRRDGQLFLIDFGVVKQIATPTMVLNGHEEAVYTVGIGTPGYMPSEQAHGEPKFASDLYAIGMIGIQALTGIPPSHLEKDDNLEIVWRPLAPKVYPEFADILSRMVRFDFRQRYANAHIAYEALKEFRDRYPISDVNHSLPTIRLSTIQSSNAISDSVRDLHSAQNPPSKKSAIWQYLQPWQWFLGFTTLGAIVITTVVLLLSVPPKASRTDVSEEVTPATTVPQNSTQTSLKDAPSSGTTTGSISLVKEFSSNDAIYGVALSPDGKTLAGASAERNIDLWDFATGKKIQTLKGNTGRVYDIYFSPDGKRLVSASDDRKVMIWDVKSSKTLNILEGHQERVYTAIFSPDGKMIASSGGDRTIRLWNAETGKPIKTFLEKSWVYDVSFTPDGKVLVSACKDGAIHLWNVETGKVVKTLVESGSSVRAINYSNNGKLIASAMEDNTVRLWDATTGQLKEVLTGHTGEVHTLDFSKDDRLLASGSADKTVRVWHLKEKRSPQVLADHERGVASVEFSPDQKFLISGSLDGKIKIWKLAL
ncbi:serine/threonine-protein kinase [Pseudanabaena sp. Chao 1811]|uniref:serine/threonine-protein kinase n=1 Tax=Pseudanabaena sp. Chao 1811 TaxID=2963092 RepID=UPI0022F3C3BC|nr:serine/threonine-protein kinase [Pseudanabaena sp. Chao 1811]